MYILLVINSNFYNVKISVYNVCIIFTHLEKKVKLID